MPQLLESSIENGICAVSIKVPRIEARIADELTEGLIAAFAQTRAAVIDFSGVGFIDSVGMKTLMTVLLHCRKNQCACVLHGIDEDIMSIFVITRLNKLLPLAENLTEALEKATALMAQQRERTMGV
jgi:anti-sigma B factor antagonist